MGGFGREEAAFSLLGGGREGVMKHGGLPREAETEESASRLEGITSRST